MTTKSKKPVRLPAKPSKLIRLALKDLAKIEADPKFVVNMDTWVAPGRNSSCSVCLAGSIMVRDLNRSPSRCSTPVSFDNRTKHILYAVNSFRYGGVIDGKNDLFRATGKRITSKVRNRVIVHYPIDPVKFRAQLNKLADDFEKEGN